MIQANYNTETLNSYVTDTNNSNGWGYGNRVFRQGSYGSGYATYTGVAQFNHDEIKRMYQTYYPVAASVSLENREAIGSHNPSLNALIGIGQGAYGSAQPPVIYASKYESVDGGPGTTKIIPIDTSWIDTFCNTGSPIITLGDFTKNPSYLGYTRVVLNIDWEVRYTSVLAPTNISISKTRGVPYDTAILSWSGASAGTQNPITAYHVYYRDNGQGDWIHESGWNVQTSSTSGSVSVFFPGDRGSYREFQVYTIGTQPRYHSGPSPATPACYVNNLPILNTCSVNSNLIPSDRDNIKVSISLSGYDVDGTISYFWGKDSGHSDQQLINNNSELTVESGTYYCYPWDGMEYGDPKTITFSKNTKPEIYSVTTSGMIDSSKDKNYPFAKSLSLSSTSNKTNNSNIRYNWEYKTSSTKEQLSSASWNTLSSNYSPNINFLNYIDYSNYYTIRLQISEIIGNYEDKSEYYEIENGFRYPNIINKDLITISELFAPISTQYHDEEGNLITRSDQFFNNSLKFILSNNLGYFNNDTSLDIPKIMQLAIGYRIEPNGSLKSITSISDNTSEFSMENFPETFLDNTPIYFTIRFRDYFGVIYENSTAIIRTYVSGPKFSADSIITVNPSSLKPLSYENDIYLNFSKESSIWTDTLSDTYIQNGYLNERYKFYVDLPTVLSGQSNRIEIPSDKISYNIPPGNQLGDTINVIFDNSLNDYLKEQILLRTGTINTEFSCTIYIFAKDYLNLSSSINLQRYIIDFKESPTFGTAKNSDFKLEFIYSNDDSSKSGYLTGNNGTNLINIGEKVRFYFPKASDLNDDIINYSIYSRRSSSDYDNTINSSNPSSYIRFKDIPILINNEANPDLKTTTINGQDYYYYDIQVSTSYNYNQFASYAIQAMDSNELLSEFMYFGYDDNNIQKPIMIQICRVSNPNINLIEYNSEKLDTGNYYDILVKANIPDIGGSLYQNPTSEFKDYGSARNFERDFFNDINKMTITVQLAELDDPDFANPISYSYKTYTNSDSNYPYGNDNIINIPSLTESKQILLDSNKYIRLFIEIIYGKLDNTSNNYRKISYFSSTSVFYIETPTVSYRKNSVGINDDNLEDNEVFAIKNVSDKTKIALKGLDDAGNSKEILIDLSSGEITKEGVSNTVSLCGVKTFLVTLEMDTTTSLYTLESPDFINHSVVFVNLDYGSINPIQSSDIIKAYRKADFVDGNANNPNQISLKVNGKLPTSSIEIPLVITVMR